MKTVRGVDTGRKQGGWAAMVQRGAGVDARPLACGGSYLDVRVIMFLSLTELLAWAT